MATGEVPKGRLLTKWEFDIMITRGKGCSLEQRNITIVHAVEKFSAVGFEHVGVGQSPVNPSFGPAWPRVNESARLDEL